ncbi:MAG: hypothetical protein AAGB22_10485 [Bacteroidota bacterium]
MRALTLPTAALLALVFLAGCEAYTQKQTNTAPATAEPANFNAYWYSGKAELNHYTLTQARYGEQHPGHAVLVFVTEDFRTDLQVKLESGQRKSAVSVLKLNLMRKFRTGVYDYSMMTSVFSPVGQAPLALKVTTSSQEWCGHEYTQLNLRKGQYQVQGRSYFEREVAEDYQVPEALTEDGLWNTIRLQPDALPTGDLRIIPGTQYARLRHRTLQAEKATASRSAYTGADFPGEELQRYTIRYPDLNRALTIVYEGQFPHRIAGWEEQRISGFGPGASTLLTRAVRTKTLRSDYWNRNRVKDLPLRRELMGE